MLSARVSYAFSLVTGGTCFERACYLAGCNAIDRQALAALLSR